MDERMEEALRISRARWMLASGEGKRIRKEGGLSLSDVARALQTGIATVMRWEDGERSPRAALALRYLEFVEALQEEMADR